jgi:hypothetical protein
MKEKKLRIAVIEIKLYAPWVHSLKEKRMEVKSLIAKIRNKFNVSVAEANEQDTHQTIVIGIAAIAANSAQGDSIIDNIISFVESNTDAQVAAIERRYV